MKLDVLLAWMDIGVLWSSMSVHSKLWFFVGIEHCLFLRLRFTAPAAWWFQTPRVPLAHVHQRRGWTSINVRHNFHVALHWLEGFVKFERAQNKWIKMKKQKSIQAMLGISSLIWFLPLQAIKASVCLVYIATWCMQYLTANKSLGFPGNSRRDKSAMRWFWCWANLTRFDKVSGTAIWSWPERNREARSLCLQNCKWNVGPAEKALGKIPENSRNILQHLARKK